MSIILNLFIALFLLIHPVQATSNEHTATETLGKVYCDNLNQSCHSYTVKDVSGGSWNIDIDNPTNLNLVDLNAQYKGKLIKIIYSGNVQTDNSIEIISEEIIN